MSAFSNPRDPIIPYEQLTAAQKDALAVLALPMLAEIHFVELSGNAPAVPNLPGSGMGAHVFTETRFVWDDHPLRGQVGGYLLGRKLIERTREDYDHHVRVTEDGINYLKLQTAQVKKGINYFGG